jgi:chromate transporter
MAPHAAPDIFTWILLALTIGLILQCKFGPLPLMAGGGVIGLLSRGYAMKRLEEFVR